MSVQAISWALEDAVVLHTDRPATEVPAELVSLLVGLANHADREGRHAWPSVTTLASYTRKSDRQVQRGLQKLVELDLIREGDQRLVMHLRADRRPVVYDLAMSWLRGDIHVTPNRLERGDTYVTPSRSRGDTGDAHGVTPVSPEPSLEPSETEVSTEGDSSAREADDVDSHPAARAIPPEDRARLDQLGAEAAAAVAAARREQQAAAPRPTPPAPRTSGREEFKRARAELAERIAARQQRETAEVNRLDQLAPCPTCDRVGTHVEDCPDDPATELPADAVLVHAPDPHDRSGPASRDQLTALAVGYPGGRDERLAWCSRNVGRPVDSMVELTSREASKLLDLLAREPEPPTFASTDDVLASAARIADEDVTLLDRLDEHEHVVDQAFGPDDPPF